MKLNTEMSDVKTLGHGGSQLSTRSQMKRTRASNQRIPKWAYLLFIILAAFVTYRILQHRASEIKTAQPPARPVLVAKVISKDVPIYLDEIGTCAAYETVQIQAQVSGQIIARHFRARSCRRPVADPVSPDEDRQCYPVSRRKRTDRSD